MRTIVWTYQASQSREHDSFAPLGHLHGKWIEDPQEKLRLLVAPQQQIEFAAKGESVWLRFKKGDWPMPADDLELKHGVILLHHDKSMIRGYELIPQAVNVLDYSSSDASRYREMLQDVKDIRSRESLVQIAGKWIGVYAEAGKHYMLRQVRHTALNLFLTLCIDIRSIQNLWHKRESSRLKKLLDQLAQSWQVPLSFSRSPYAQLIRFWYVLAGQKVHWGKIGLTPPADVFLPREKWYKPEKDLYSWLLAYRGHAMPPEEGAWEQLVDLSGLVQVGEKFTKKKTSCIANFVGALELLVKSPDPHIWLRDLDALAGRKHKGTPLTFLWYLLALAETNQIPVAALQKKKFSYDHLHQELARLTGMNSGIAIDDFWGWVNALNAMFDELHQAI